MDITGASAVVTGGASGLGLATVERLLAAGAAVTILDLPSSPGEAVAEKLANGYDGRVRFAPADVTDEDAVRAALDVAGEQAPLRVAVNCAGTGDAIRILGRNGVYPLERFTRIVQINLIGTFNVIRLAAERMVAHEPLGDVPNDQERGVI